TAKLVNNLANVQRVQGKLAEALEGYRKAVTLHSELAADRPDEPDYQYDLTIHQDNIAGGLRDLDRPGEAEAAGDAARTARTLVERHPSFPLYLERLGEAQLRLGRLALDRDPAAAEAYLLPARNIFESLSADYPHTPRYAAALGMVLNNLGLAARARGEAP